MKEILKGLLESHSHGEIKAMLKEILDEQPKIEILLNNCHGGYSFSAEAYHWMVENGYVPQPGDSPDCFCPDRKDPLAIACVKAIGEAANGDYASLGIALVPQGASWYIEEYDGRESVVW